MEAAFGMPPGIWISDFRQDCNVCEASSASPKIFIKKSRNIYGLRANSMAYCSYIAVVASSDRPPGPIGTNHGFSICSPTLYSSYSTLWRQGCNHADVTGT